MNQLWLGGERCGRCGHADFCELLIDNFLHVDPAAMRADLGDTPVAFHVMNSRFLEQGPVPLEALAARLRELMAALHPLYVSDHLGWVLPSTRGSPHRSRMSTDTGPDPVGQLADGRCPRSQIATPPLMLLQVLRNGR